MSPGTPPGPGRPLRPGPGPAAHLVAVGDPIADLVVPVPATQLGAWGIVPGTATFCTRDELDAAAADLGKSWATATAGGSAANTAAAFSALGGTSCLLGVTYDDEPGRVVRRDLSSRAVHLPLSPESPRSSSAATGRCLVLVTPGGERSFLAWQGAPDRFTALTEALPSCLAHTAAPAAVLVEGYLLTTRGGFAVAREALRGAGAAGAVRVLSLSDPGVAAAHADAYAELLAAGVDIVIGNAEEAAALTGFDDVARALAALSDGTTIAVVTSGSGGAAARHEGRTAAVAAKAVRVENAAGAGDSFAAAFVIGALSGRSLPDNLAAAAEVASLAVQAPGARFPPGEILARR